MKYFNIFSGKSSRSVKRISSKYKWTSSTILTKPKKTNKNHSEPIIKKNYIISPFWGHYGIKITFWSI